MKRIYIPPSFFAVQVETSAFLCQSYGTIPVGGRTDSFDDNGIGTISTGGGIGTISTGGGRTDELDAPRSRDWIDYETW